MNFIQINSLTFNYRHKTVYFLFIRNKSLTKKTKSRELKFHNEQSLFFFDDKEKIKAKRNLTAKKDFDDRNDSKKFEREKFQRRKRSEEILTIKINFLFSFKFR